ncbi:MAG: ATP-binding cassette domain-containing protein [Phycisphaeraceae bacterium]
MTTVATQPTPAPAVEPPATQVVRCLGLTKVFKDFWMRDKAVAVDHIDLHVNQGEVFGLLGPNGSGKSTTIKMILGLLHPTSGRVTVLGKQPTDVASKKRIGYLPEESYLYKFLNAYETLDYYGRLFHLDRRQRAKRIETLLQMVGLEGVARRNVGSYSKGMQRRIGLAQALINDPDLLILDEPTTGMDPIGTRQIKDLIVELARRGKTIILCSHLLADVESVCDRVALMFGGKIDSMGTVDDLLVQQDKTTLETAVLDVATLEQIERVLQAHGRQIDKVDQPRQSLESYFIDRVLARQAQGAATSGARNAGLIADFLRGQPVQDREGEGVIKTLVAAGETVAAPAKAPLQAPAPVAPATPAVDKDVLADLLPSRPEKPGRQEAADAAQTHDRPEAPAAGAEALGSLITQNWQWARSHKPKEHEDPAQPHPQPHSPKEHVQPDRPAEPVPPAQHAEYAVPTPDLDARTPRLPDQPPSLPLESLTKPPAQPPAGASAADVFDAPPSGDELKLIDQLGSSWTAEEGKDKSQPEAAAKKPDAAPEAKQDDKSEQPDKSFLDALMDVPPFEEDKGKKNG